MVPGAALAWLLVLPPLASTLCPNSLTPPSYLASSPWREFLRTKRLVPVPGPSQHRASLRYGGAKHLKTE